MSVSCNGGANVKVKDAESFLGRESEVFFTVDLECAPDGGRIAGWELTGATGLSEDESHGQAPHAQHRVQTADRPGLHCRRDASCSRQRHDISRNLIRIWVRKAEAGAFDDDAQAADLLQDYEAKIAALERMVGRQALEIEFLKGALKNAPRPRSASTSVITGPVVSPSPKDAG